ncbi:DNA methyltransferase [Azospirillum sp. HJ39]|uniref:Eco57I restriction-modification methylase domain-containing protein n=1 Tax=Azospirillum sp. HJ39 TaxID=3159496 RepID=UPI0035577C9B
MTEILSFDPDLEWLDHVQPVGLVVGSSLLKELGLVPPIQTQRDSAEVAELLAGPEAADSNAPALPDPWAFVEGVLNWPAALVAGSPGGPALPDELFVRLPEHDTVLQPHWAVRAGARDPGWQLLVRIESAGVKPDDRGALDGWEATPHQRFERLLRETNVPAGLLIADRELRLIHAPRGETSGWITFPLAPLGTVAGRPMLGGLKLVLSAYRLFNDADDRRLPALLRRSREAQAAVSSALAEQVLGALHELLRGLTTAEPERVAALATDHPAQLYEGLLTVLMRLVFALYAEDRDLIPSRTDADARMFYDQGYSVRGLHGKLLEDAARTPDTMEERLGGWGRLLALFRLVHRGDGTGWIRGRGGKLFDPDAFPFLEGRAALSDPPRVPKVTDGCILRLLDGLVTLKGERLSYRTLDVEQIGSVYETVMGFTVERAAGPVLAIRAGKNNHTPVFVDLAALAEAKPDARLKSLKEVSGRASLTAKQQKAIKEAKGVDGLAAALEPIVDERASPHRRVMATGTPILQPTDERRSTGSHYTPRGLTEPIVRHALADSFARLGPDATPEQVLDLKVCDPAMGSGAFLVEACRAVASRLVQAWARWPETRPIIPADEDEDLHARRLVAQRCLYGVDKNPMAADLARLSLWLATLARDHEFTFLDHALKAGDSLVGLTRAQIAALHWDAARAGLPLFRALVNERFEAAVQGRAEIRDAEDNVSRAIQEERYRKIEQRLDSARQIGDAVVAAFFAADKPKGREARRQAIENWVNGPAAELWPKLETLRRTLTAGGAHPTHPFHWELEFPEVFARDNPGFDAIVGNPPFAGKNTIAAGNQGGFIDWLQTLHAGAHGNADLVAHFFRRAYGLLRVGGVFGLIATNTIGQGDTRQTGLAAILKAGGAIPRAVRRLKWPGEAAVVVSVVHVRRDPPPAPPSSAFFGTLFDAPPPPPPAAPPTVPRGAVLDERPVSRISAYLVEGDRDDPPARLAANAGMAFQGSIVLGMGFTFDDQAAAKGTASSLDEMRRLIAKDPRNAERIFPYIGGEEVNNDPRHAHRRYVIDFGDMPLKRDERERGWFLMTPETQAKNLREGSVPQDYPEPVAEDWPDLIEIVRRLVKGTRGKHSTAHWWHFERRRGDLLKAMIGNDSFLTMARHSPQFSIATITGFNISAESLIVFPANELNSFFTVVQGRTHEAWTRFFASSMKDDLRYTPSDCFETFPFPQAFETNAALEAAGQAYHDHRAQLMVTRNEGLTKTYNRFHDPADTTPDTRRLRDLHADMDRAVLHAYGWDDLARRAQPIFLDATNEDDHKYLNRLFWPADLRDEVLARLLALNATRAAEEKAQGLTQPPGWSEEEDLEEV